MRLRVAGLVVLSAFSVTNAHSQTATGTLNVSITIAATCSVVGATAINFGSVSAIAANIDQTSTLTVNCSSTTPYTVSLPVGTGGGTVAARRMANGANFVTYGLYSNAARTTLWGTGPGETIAGTGTAANQTLTIYARVPPQTVPPPGVYSDAVTVTVTY
ncbi:MAG: spore coat U domain-containing protein [Beijerinckiaceae bacterium]|jgi:spore coat protein U-like protein|nr:spore coat U domain-containing protein [Beijerinckiaceae bacterium]